MAADRIIGRLDGLIDMGEQVLRTQNSDGYVETGLVQQWRTSSMAFLDAVLGPNSTHYHQFENRCKGYDIGDAKNGIGILKAAREDIKGGYLQKIEALVSAEVFSDFLEMAEHLFENDYKEPAASLIGAVLEDGLRRICVTNKIDVERRDGINSLNKKLTENKVYNPLQQKQIQVWNDIRNNADHHHFDEYKKEDVKDMLAGVQRFLSEYIV